MKQGIHPEYVPTTVTCTCGNTFETAWTCARPATPSTPASRRFWTPVVVWLASRLATASARSDLGFTALDGAPGREVRGIFASLGPW